MSETVLFSGGRFYSAAEPRASAMLVSGGRIAWLGERGDAPAADRVVELDGALVAPAFVDAHVHVTDTGLEAEGLVLSGVRSAAELLEAVAGHEAPGEVVLASGWDESTWGDKRLPSAEELERASGGRMVYAPQASGHAALVSRSLLARCPQIVSDGLVREDEHHLVRAVALGSVTPAHRDAVQRAALREAAARGVAAVHECGGPGTSSEDDFVAVLAQSGGPRVFGYWGELGAVEKARELGAVGAGGDLYADGAFGSRTAFVREPYVDGEGCGRSFVTAEQAGAHLVACTQAGLQGGFHAIGDAAIEAVLGGFAIAAAALGVDRVRAARHRIEHVEFADKAMIARLVEFGVVASVQPMFDALWGGAGRMYAQRLGRERALALNPIGAMYGTGVTLAFGSDSPVTGMDPWGTVVAAAAPSNPVFRMSVRAAFGASTRGGWRAAGVDDAGVLVPGAQASFAVWETPGGLEGGLPRLLPDADGEVPPRPVCRRTVLAGETIYEG